MRPSSLIPNKCSAIALPGAWFARSGLEVHQQARARIDLHDGPALGVHGFGDVSGDHVDARDVQPHHPGGQGGHRRDFWVNPRGDVVVHVAIALHDHHAIFLHHAVSVQALTLQFQDRMGLSIQAYFVERKILLDATPGVAVDLSFDQLGNGGCPIARDGGQLAFGSRHDPIADHQQAMLLAFDVALDNDVRGFGLGHMKGRLHLFLGFEVQGDPASMIGVQGFDHDGQTDVLSNLPRLGGAVHNLALRDRDAATAEQALGQIFVAGDALGNGAGAIAFCGPNATLA